MRFIFISLLGEITMSQFSNKQLALIVDLLLDANYANDAFKNQIFQERDRLQLLTRFKDATSRSEN